MTFLTIPFLILFTITYIIVLISKTNKRRKVVLLIASYVFYAWWDVRFLFLMIFEEFICYYLALKIKRCEKKECKKFYVLMGVLISLGILGYYKYFDFFRETFYNAFNIQNYTTLNIILPIGISFYTFQSLSYLIDVYREKVEAKEDFLTISLYVSFFPQLVAGPIVRSDVFLPQLEEYKPLTKANFLKGIQIFMMGAFKKAVIADRLAVCVDAVFGAPSAYSGISILCAIVSYTIQIYCDFSGYSDMAIGIAEIFGYELCQNFNVPYISKNPTEFWKRWHISLSSWLQEYLYISLGGNRKGTLRTYINLLITMFLGGLWHGASWTFVVWGILHGMGLVIHKLWLKYKKTTRSSIYKDMLCISLNLVFVMICWVFFRAETLEDAIVILQRLFTWSDGIIYVYSWSILFGILTFGAHIWAQFKNNRNGKYIILDLSKMKNQIIFFVVFWIILGFSYFGNNAFIYFQF